MPCESCCKQNDRVGTHKKYRGPIMTKRSFKDLIGTTVTAIIFALLGKIADAPTILIYIMLAGPFVSLALCIVSYFDRGGEGDKSYPVYRKI